MNTKKEIYQNILAISKEIELLISLGNFEKIDHILDKRQIFINQIEPQDKEFGEIKVLIDQICAIDEVNFQKLSEQKDEIYRKMKNVSRGNQMLSKYKLRELNTSRNVDERS
ncbi:MAG: hypothetical protein PHE78_06305 [Candidatus Gastranaerophilales bacterium]|nr:hypothetical protein [Candidatus Gastranaerophilales bacterium]